MNSFKLLSLSACITLALVTGCKQPSAPAPDAQAPAATVAHDSAAFQSAVDAFIDGAFQHNPVFAANSGKHEFDGKLPDYSPAGLKATADWLHAQRDTFAAFSDDKLDEKGRFQRDYVLAVIDGQLFWLEDSGFAYNNPAFYTGDLSPSMYLTRPYARCRSAWRRSSPTRKRCRRRSNRSRPTSNCRCRRPISILASTLRRLRQFFKTDVPAIFAEVKDDACRHVSRPAMPPRSRLAGHGRLAEVAEAAGHAGLRAGRGEILEDAACDRTRRHPARPAQGGR